MKKFLFSMASILLIMLLFASCGKKQEVNVNLLENPSFESADGNKPDAWVLDRYDASGPSSDYGVFAFSDAPDGSNVLVLENLDANDARYYQEVEVEKNSYYKLSARVKTENIVSSTDSGANLSILGTYFSSDLVTDGEWTEITVYGKTDSKIKKAER